MSAYAQNKNKGGEIMTLADYINTLDMDVRAEKEEDGTITIYFDNVEQDYFIEGVKTPKDIENAYDCFEIEDEVYMWLEAKRNGIKGVPEILELVKEEQLINKTLGDLYRRTRLFKEVE